jgi:hypothetical protein
VSGPDRPRAAWRRSLSTLVCLLICLDLAPGAQFPALAPASQPLPAGGPRLIVLVVFDQLRADYLERWQDLWEEGGFRRLQKEGAWFQNCNYPYACTFTGPGHGSIVTGCSPARHGIVGDYWLDRATGKDIDCAVTKDYQPVPLNQAIGNGGSSPCALLAPPVGDLLKTATDGKSRVVSLSLKDRSAVLMGGFKPDACYWLDVWSGQFMTSTYYRDRLHGWVAEFNRGKPADGWFGKDWTRLRPSLDYVRYSGPDDVAAEDKAWFQGRTFPHPTTGGLDKPGRDYYGAVACSPYGNELLLQLAERAIDGEQLGRHETPDLLCVSFSANDDVGHAWGPDSQEVLDMTLRSDRLVRDLLNYLDSHVGRGEYLLLLTSDHGVCPMPELSRRQGKAAGRIPPRHLLNQAEQYLDEHLGKSGDKGHWFEGRADCWLYLNSKVLDNRGIQAKFAEATLADWLKQQPSILSAYTRTQITSRPPENAMEQLVWRSFRTDRCGDVAVILKPYYLMTSGLRGTLHGSPHEYDTHVPLLVFGKAAAAGRHAEPTSPLAVAAIICEAVHISPPTHAEVATPPRLLQTVR